MESRVTEQFGKSFVRIKTADGVVVGAGFLIADEEHVLTCAHVVVEALHISSDTGEEPQGTVHLDFPFLSSAAHTARVEHWLPPSGPSTNPSGDIAVLRLDNSPPHDAQPARLTVAKKSYGRK